MFHKDASRRRTWRGRAVSLFLTAALLLGSIPGLTVPAAAEHWADPYLDQLVDWGVMRADQAGSPDTPLTRAEFMAVINRAYGYTEVGPMPFTDVSEDDWFYDDVAIAYTAGYMKGTSETTASPNDSLTREQAVCILGRNMMFKETPGEDLTFTDSRSISSWARGMVKTAVDNYIVNGYPDDTFRPKENITKGQMAALVTQCVGNPVNAGGAYELGGVFGNVTVTAPNVTLRNTTVSGDLYVSGGVGLGGVKLENVNVLGRIIVSGTGESESGSASVIMRNVEANELLVDNMRKKYVTVRADGITEIARTSVRTNAYLEDNNTDDKGLLNISLEGEPGTRLTLAGRVKEVVNKTPNSQIQVAKGTVARLTVDEAAVNSTVQLDRNTSVKELNLDVAANVTGEGDIDKLNVNSPGSVVAMLPDKTYIRPGLTANVAGVVMDHQAAEEGSLDPRLLSGYPAAKDIAPTAFRADFASNKKGTVYWAVSSIADGSVGAEDMISPPSYGSKAVRNGSVGLSAGDIVGSAQVNGLTTGGSYYLSAVLVDGQGERSPVKVISFTTPDNTVPAFAQGYPYMSRITRSVAQVTVMPTKSCKLYYALLPQGAAVPTVNDMKSAAVTGNLGYGVRDVTKNTEDVFTVNSQRLDELKNYVLYLWLTDVDGANSSAIRPLQFTVPDETPPEVDVPVQESCTGNSVNLISGMSERGTIFWAVVAEDFNYPLPNTNNPNSVDNIRDVFGNPVTSKLDSLFAKTCVENGRSALVKGSAAVSAAGTDVTFRVTGKLEPEKSYKLYYVGKDAAGNYSREVGVITIKTADTSGPIVYQYFSAYKGEDRTERPLANSDIILNFNEPITVGASKELLSLYQTSIGRGENKSDAVVNSAKKELKESLQANFKLNCDRDNTFADVSDAEDRAAAKNAAGHWIDYNDVEVRKDQETGHIEVVFKSGKNIQMKSATEYYFVLHNLRDNADASRNLPLDNSGRPTNALSYKNAGTNHVLKKFTTAFATVKLEELDADPQPALRGDAAAGTAYIDTQFYMVPESVGGVDNSKRYDIFLFASEQISYDLYYRITENANSENRKIYKIGDKIGDKEIKDYLLPSKATTITQDEEGWIYLGESPETLRNSEGKYASTVMKSVIGTDNFPTVNSLGENLRYEFAISLTKLGNNSSRDTWALDDDMSIDIYVMSDTNTNLDRVFRGGTYTPASLGARGVESIGEPEPRTVYVTLGDTAPPVFGNDMQFHTPSTKKEGATTTRDVTKIDLDFMLDRRGASIYYRIVPKNANTPISTRIKVLREVTYTDDNGVQRKVEKGAVLDINTDKDAFYGVISAQTAGSRMPVGKNRWQLYNAEDKAVDKDADGSPWYYEVVDTDKRLRADLTDLQNSYNNYPKGSVTYGLNSGTDSDTIPGTGALEADTEYYIYMVLVGTKGLPSSRSQVYIYNFKTQAALKPLIGLVDQKSGNVNISISYPSIDGKSDLDTEAHLNWALFQSINGKQYLEGRWIDIPSVITGYSRMNMLKALTTTYSASTAYGAVPLDAEYGTQYDGYTIFDVFATEDQKRDLVTQIITTDNIDQINSSAFKNQGQTQGFVQTSRQRHVADWKTGAKLKDGETIESVTGLLVVAAHNEGNEPGRNDWHKVDSFRAIENVKVTNQAAPTLLNSKNNATGIGVSGAIYMVNVTEEAPTVSGNIRLTFDSPVYWRGKENGIEIDYQVLADGSAPTGTGDDATVGILYGLADELKYFITVDQQSGGPFTSFNLQIANLPISGAKNFDLLGSPGNIAAKDGNNGGFIRIKIEKGYYTADEPTNNPENPTETKKVAYYKPKITVTNFGYKGATGPSGTIEAEPPSQVGGSGASTTVYPPELLDVGGKISGTYEDDKFTIKADSLLMRFSEPLYWKEPRGATYYRVVAGEADAGEGTPGTVGILSSNSYDAPKMKSKVGTTEYGLEFDVTLENADKKSEFTILNYGEIFSQGGNVGATGGIKVEIRLGGERSDTAKKKVVRDLIVTVTYKGGSKQVQDIAPIEIRDFDELALIQAGTSVVVENKNSSDGFVATVTLPFNDSVNKDSTAVTNIASIMTKEGTGKADITATAFGKTHTLTIKNISSDANMTYTIPANQLSGPKTTTMQKAIKITVKYESTKSGVFSNFAKVTVTVKFDEWEKTGTSPSQR